MTPSWPQPTCVCTTTPDPYQALLALIVKITLASAVMGVLGILESAIRGWRSDARGVLDLSVKVKEADLVRREKGVAGQERALIKREQLLVAREQAASLSEVRNCGHPMATP